MTIADSIQLQTLHDKIDLVSTHVDNLNTLLSHSNDVIANEIAASDRYWSISSVMLGVIAIILGIYIAWCKLRMEKLKASVEKKNKMYSV